MARASPVTVTTRASVKAKMSQPRKLGGSLQCLIQIEDGGALLLTGANSPIKTLMSTVDVTESDKLVRRLTQLKAVN